MDDYLIEVCADNIDSVIAANKGGTARIELCASLSEGGLTPSCSFIAKSRELIQSGLHIMIRPRSGDFFYSGFEFDIMKQDILACKELGADGVVFGILLPDGTVDTRRSEELVHLAHPMSVTFHRAFDLTPDPMAALENIIHIGADRILTSGQQPTAAAGADLIAMLIQQARERIIIMPGSGINETNIQEIKHKTNAKEFHLSGRITIKSRMTFRRDLVFMGSMQGLSEYEMKVTDIEKIRQILSILKAT